MNKTYSTVQKVSTQVAIRKAIANKTGNKPTSTQQPKLISQHYTKARAMEASKQYHNPSYVRKDTSPSPYRYAVWKRRR